VFDAAYTARVTEAMPPPSAGVVVEVLPRLAPAEPVALRGCVLTPSEAIENGHVVVGEGRTIQAVQASAPQAVTVHRNASPFRSRTVARCVAHRA
jgi:hypothetical protein